VRRICAATLVERRGSASRDVKRDDVARRSGQRAGARGGAVHGGRARPVVRSNLLSALPDQSAGPAGRSSRHERSQRCGLQMLGAVMAR
jgi:hypothetical protein